MGKNSMSVSESPKALSDDSSFQVCPCIAEDHLPGGQDVWPQRWALVWDTPFAWSVSSGQREAPGCGAILMGRLTVPGHPQNVPYHPSNTCAAVTTTWNKIPVIHISLMTAVAYCPGDGGW